VKAPKDADMDNTISEIAIDLSLKQLAYLVHIGLAGEAYTDCDLRIGLGRLGLNWHYWLNSLLGKLDLQKLALNPIEFDIFPQINLNARSLSGNSTTWAINLTKIKRKGI
jgi:hypothetical protein